MDRRTCNIWGLVGIGALLHFLVDGLCLCSLYLLMNASFEMLHFFGFFVIYNVLAFLTQPLTGWWADRMEQRHWLLLLSVAFLTLGVIFAECPFVGKLPRYSRRSFNIPWHG